MLTPEELLTALHDAGYTDIVGVPCSTMSGVYRALATDRRLGYRNVPNEGSALAVAGGLLLAGRRPLVLIQNSGFGNLVNPLSSFAMPYQVPVTVLMTMRGWPDADTGEPQHAVMGGRAEQLIGVLGLPCHWLPREPGDLAKTLAEVRQDADTGSPVFLLAAPGTVATAPKPTADGTQDTAISREAAVRCAVDTFPGALFVSTVGDISRQLFAVADSTDNLYVQGAMGHAASVGAGVALARPDRRVVILDGDGSAIMHLGVASFIGSEGPRNLVHIVVDNGVYGSTGGQRTTAATTDFAAVAEACGYRSAASARTAGELRDLAAGLGDVEGPALVHIAVSAHDPVPGGRASESIGPAELARRFAQAAAPEGGPR